MGKMVGVNRMFLRLEAKWGGGGPVDLMMG